MTSDALAGRPTDVLAARGAGFRVREHGVRDRAEEVCAELGIRLADTVKTLAFVSGEDRLVLAGVPGRARLKYGEPACAAGVRRADLAPAGAERLAGLGMAPGGVCPVSADASAIAAFDASVPGMGRIHCGSGRRDSSLELDAAELAAAVPDARIAGIVQHPAADHE